MRNNGRQKQAGLFVFRESILKICIDLFARTATIPVRAIILNENFLYLVTCV